MEWYYSISGGHVQIKVLMNGSFAGTIILQAKDFAEAKAKLGNSIGFIPETIPFNTMYNTGVSPDYAFIDF